MRQFILLNAVGLPEKWPLMPTELGKYAPKNVSFPSDCSEANLEEFGLVTFFTSAIPPYDSTTQMLVEDQPAPCDGGFTQVWRVEPLAGDYIVKNNMNIINSYKNAAQALMDDKAQSLGYDNLLSAISYASDTIVSKWKTEGEIFLAWRTQVWLKCHEIENDVEAGTIPIPTMDTFLSMLPEIELPQ